MSLNLELDENTKLVQSFLSGNPKSQKLFFERFTPTMFVICLRYMGNEDDAQDALQDGFIKVFLKLPDFKNEGSLEGWVRRIFVNTCLDNIRKKQKTKSNIEISEVTNSVGFLDVELQNLELQELMSLIQSMPKGYKRVFSMFVIEGYSHKQIAEELGINENTSKSQFLRARSFLRERLQKLELN